MIKKITKFSAFLAIWLTMAATPPVLFSTIIFLLYKVGYLLWLCFPAPGSLPPHITIPAIPSPAEWPAVVWFLIPVYFCAFGEPMAMLYESWYPGDQGNHGSHDDHLHEKRATVKI